MYILRKGELVLLIEVDHIIKGIKHLESYTTKHPKKVL